MIGHKDELGAKLRRKTCNHIFVAISFKKFLPKCQSFRWSWQTLGADVDGCPSSPSAVNKQIKARSHSEDTMINLLESIRSIAEQSCSNSGTNVVQQCRGASQALLACKPRALSRTVAVKCTPARPPALPPTGSNTTTPPILLAVRNTSLYYYPLYLLILAPICEQYPPSSPSAPTTASPSPETPVQFSDAVLRIQHHLTSTSPFSAPPLEHRLRTFDKLKARSKRRKSILPGCVYNPRRFLSRARS